MLTQCRQHSLKISRVLTVLSLIPFLNALRNYNYNSNRVDVLGRKYVFGLTQPHFSPRLQLGLK